MQIEPGIRDWQRYYEGLAMPFYTADTLWNLQTAFGSNYIPGDFQPDPNSDFTAFGGGLGYLPGYGNPGIFPSIINQAGSILNTLLQPEAPAQVPQIYQQPGTMQVNVQACPAKRLKSGKLVAQHIGKNGRCITNRHMNVLNPHALSRSTRRVTGFLKRVKSTQKALSSALQRELPHGRRTTRGKGGCFTCGARSYKTCSCG